MSKESFFQDNAFYKEILDLLDIAFWSVDVISGNTFLSKGAESLLGIPRAAFEKNPRLLKEIVHPDDQYIYDLVADKLHSGMSNEYEFRVKKPNGEIRWLRGHSSFFKKPEMNIELFYGIIFDITDFIREQTELKNRNGSLENLINEVNIVVWNANLITNKAFYSPSAVNIYGISHEEFTKNPSLWKELIHPDDKVIAEKNDVLLISGKKVTCEYRIIRPNDGEIRWIEDRAIPTFDQNGKLTSFFGVKIDVTHRKLSEEKIKKLTFYDVLTGIPNNIFLENYLNDMAGKKGTNDHFAFLLIDFDRFRLINESYGHPFGDMLMIKAVERIQSVIPKNGLLCREVGDEFTLILNDVTKEQIEFFCLKLLNLFQDPFFINGIEVYTSVSIGISEFPPTNVDRKHLINQAYYTMLIAKQNGKNTYHFFDKKDEISKYKIETENELKKALKNKDFILHYQPLYHLQTGKISGMEALVRWQHPIKGFIPPSDFIPLAEKTDLIVTLGEWVLREACEHNKRLQDLGYKPLTVSVNVSTRQFYDKDFINKLKRILEKTGLKPNYLELELTESVMHNIENTKPIIKEIKMLGVKIAIDDFGTGFSSLSILKHMPLDKLKIDKSFTDDIGTTKEPLVKSIIDLGVNLDMDVVAEGIETEEQALFLKENHCDIGQGYLFSKPLPFDELEALLRVN